MMVCARSDSNTLAGVWVRAVGDAASQMDLLLVDGIHLAVYVALSVCRTSLQT